MGASILDMDERQKQTHALREAMRSTFPLCDDRDLPFTPSELPHFLRKRIALEVEEGVKHFQTRVVKVLCEASPPKTHVEDMCRIVVNKLKDVELEMQRRIQEFTIQRDWMLRLGKCFGVEHVDRMADREALLTKILTICETADWAKEGKASK